MRFWLRELRRALARWRFWLTVGLGLGLLLLGMRVIYGLERTIPGWPRNLRNAYEAWLTSLDAFLLYAPLAAPLAYADALVEERRTGWARYVLIRMPYARYRAGKILLGGLIGALALVLPGGLFFLVTAAYFGRYPPPIGPEWPRAFLCEPGTVLCDLYAAHPDAYIAARLGLWAAFGAMAVWVGLAMTAFTTNRYVPLLGPWVLHMVLAFGVEIAGLSAYSPFMLLAPTHPGVHAQHLARLWLLGSGLSLGILFTRLRREDFAFSEGKP